ncbi:MAG: hypothetical protein APR62_07240 [Smithella sp. SDB]|nr:MAG: hypothetical protein APR62_07240 [Smithella sp. SDB]
MHPNSRSFLAIVITGIWINASEFFRNEVLLKKYWIDHYQSLGMVFPSASVNGIMWIIWGFLFAITIYSISRKFNLLQTTLLGWLMSFVLMWIVIWNLNVLPGSILVCAVPLSLLEAFIGSYICKKISPIK